MEKVIFDARQVPTIETFVINRVYRLSLRANARATSTTRIKLLILKGVIK